MLVSIIIPCFNEKDYIEIVIEKILKLQNIAKEIIIVDDHSTDGTREILEQKLKNKVSKIIFSPKNQGKGSAIKLGIEHATGDIILIQDADLEYDPNDYHQLLAPFIDNDADAVYGSRFIDNKKRRVIYFLNTIANKILTFLTNCFLNLNFTDVETGYKLFKRELVQDINIKEKGFGFEIELTMKLARKNIKFYEVGVSYSGRSYQEGKKIKKRHFFEAIYCIFKYRFLS